MTREEIAGILDVTGPFQDAFHQVAQRGEEPDAHPQEQHRHQRIPEPQGALIASVALYKGYNAIQAKIYGTLAFFPMLPSWPTMGWLCGGLVCVGTLIGALGSSISLRKFLDV